MPRLRTSAFVATSLDGFLAREDGSIDFLDAVTVPDEDYGFAEFMGSVDTLLVGRATYDTVLGFDEWPFDGKRVFVRTRRPESPRHDERFVRGEPLELLETLARAGARHVYVDGGETIRAFVRDGALDSLTLSIVPVVLGSGRRLFEAPLPTTRLVLEDARTYASGLVQMRYRVGGERLG